LACHAAVCTLCGCFLSRPGVERKGNTLSWGKRWRANSALCSRPVKMVESRLSYASGLRRSTTPALFWSRRCCVSNNTFACKRSGCSAKAKPGCQGERAKHIPQAGCPYPARWQLNPTACSSRSLTLNPCSRRDHNLPLRAWLFCTGSGKWSELRTCLPGFLAAVCGVLPHSEERFDCRTQKITHCG